MPDYLKDAETVRRQFETLQTAGEALSAGKEDFTPEIAVFDNLPAHRKKALTVSIRVINTIHLQIYSE